MEPQIENAFVRGLFHNRVLSVGPSFRIIA